jgi:hypothetical protein
MNNKEEQIFKTMMKFAPRLVSYGKAKCDLCGGLGDVNKGEVSAVTDAATGNKKYFYVCYDCLHKRVDADNIYNIYPDEERDKWRASYKAIKKRRITLNTYDELCLNCFIATNDIQAFKPGDNYSNYLRDHKAVMLVDEGYDTYETYAYADEITSIPYDRKDRRAYSENVEFHTTISIRPCSDRLDLKVCKGRGSLLCEDCRFRKEEK